MPRFADQLERFFYDPEEDASALTDVGGDSDDLRPAPVEESVQEFLSFFLAGECYAVAIEEVREIVRVPALTELPRAEPSLLGVMNLRGEVLPVYDLKLRLRLSETPAQVAGPAADLTSLGRGARVVMVRGEEGDAGVLVDGVSEVVRLRASAIEPPPSGTAERECVLGLGRQGDQLFILLDVQRALG